MVRVKKMLRFFLNPWIPRDGGDRSGGGLQKAKNFTQKQIDSATIDETTILPYYLKKTQL